MSAKRVIHHPQSATQGVKTTPTQTTRRKKTSPKAGFSSNQADYLAADAAAEAAVEAAAEAATAASAATEAAEAAVAAAAAASAAAGAGAGAGAGAVSTTGAGATTGASSFFEQAARATAIRETISKDFFMGFSLINSQNYTTFVAMNNYR